MNYILKYLKGFEPIVKNTEQIRQNRIMIWVSTLNIREARCNIGHKYLSSTESFVIQNKTELVEEVNRVHLFG